MENQIYAAMAKAFPKIEGALKDSNNPHFKSKYADLTSVVEAIKPALIENDLFFTQKNHERDGGVAVETIVYHAGGESISFGILFVPAVKRDAQGYGSALTYARRYSLMAAFGVCPEDDDGNAASKAQQDSGGYVGPKGGKTALKSRADAFYRDLLGCGDKAQLAGLLESRETEELKADLQANWPGYLDGSGFTEDFEPIYALVRRLKKELPEGDVK